MVVNALGHLYFLLGLGAIAALALTVSLYRSIRRRYRLPYVADTALYSPGQMAFLAVLERALGPGYRVFGPVHAADAIEVRRRLDRRTRRRAWERLADRRFDFLVCHARSSAIACAVNLAPRSRVLGRGVPRDALDAICAAAGLPLIRFREAESYSVVEIEERVLCAIQAAGRGLPPAPQAQPAHDPDAVVVADDRQRPLALRRLVPPEAPPPAPLPPRLEPTLSGTGDIDLGPSFRIDGDLEEEERPPRRRRRV